MALTWQVHHAVAVSGPVTPGTWPRSRPSLSVPALSSPSPAQIKWGTKLYLGIKYSLHIIAEIKNTLYLIQPF